jgi:hypothetical protein
VLEDLTPTQRALAERMSEISEDTYCAGWLVDLEYDLWQILIGEQGTFSGMVSEPEIQQLRELSDACGGWIFYDDDRAETFVPLTQWLTMFAAHAKERRA